MTTLSKHITKDISEFFTSETLTQEELAVILGGKRRNGKSRDRDILDLDDDEKDVD